MPVPHVVELDLLTKEIEIDPSVGPIGSNGLQQPPPEGRVTLGKKMQDVLAAATGRRTVPNILINGKSIGGADEIHELDRQGVLAKRIKEVGGRWVLEVGRRGFAKLDRGHD